MSVKQSDIVLNRDNKAMADTVAPVVGLIGSSAISKELAATAAATTVATTTATPTPAAGTNTAMAPIAAVVATATGLVPAGAQKVSREDALKKRNIKDKQALDSVIAILERYRNMAEKESNTLPSPEVAIRRAAASNGKLLDIKSLMRLVKDINALEPDSKERKTALDQAIRKLHALEKSMRDFNYDVLTPQIEKKLKALQEAIDEQNKVVQFLRGLKPRRLIKALSEGETISIEKEDVEIMGDIPRNAKIIIKEGDLIIRGSVKDGVEIRLSRTPLVDIRHNGNRMIADYAIKTSKGYELVSEKLIIGGTISGATGKQSDGSYLIDSIPFKIDYLQEAPLLKGNLTIHGTISDTTDIAADGDVRVGCKKLTVPTVSEHLEKTSLSYHVEEALLKEDDLHYENVFFFKKAVLKRDSTSYLFEPLVITAARHNKPNYLRTLIELGHDNNQSHIDYYRHYSDSDIPISYSEFSKRRCITALSVALQENHPECVEVICNSKRFDVHQNQHSNLLLTLCNQMPDQENLKGFMEWRDALKDSDKTFLRFVYGALHEEEQRDSLTNHMRADSPRIAASLLPDLWRLVFAYIGQHNSLLEEELKIKGCFYRTTRLGRYCFSGSWDPKPLKVVTGAHEVDPSAKPVAALTFQHNFQHKKDDAKGGIKLTREMEAFKLNFKVLCDVDHKTDLTHKQMKQLIEYAASEGLLNYVYEFLWSRPKETPLMYACAYGCTQYCQILIDNGADINFKTTEANTALRYSLLYGKIECAKMLLERGAILKTQNSNLFTKMLIKTAGEGGCLDEFIALLKELNRFDEIREDLTSKPMPM